MSPWVARYEEGYVTVSGDVVTLSDRFHRDPGWRTPEDAMKYWRSRQDLSGPGVRAYGNGLEQVDDVRGRREFAQLGVDQIWRRVTFALA